MTSLNRLAWTSLFLLSLAACKKDSDEPASPAAPTSTVDLTAAMDNVNADNYFNDIQVEVDNAASSNGLRSMDEDCAPTVTVDTLEMPHTITIDFGTSDCTAANGRMRRGVLYVPFTGPYRAAGTVITIPPQGYYVDDNHVAGTRTVTNMGLNEDHKPWFTVVTDATVTAGDGSWTATHHAERVRTWADGFDTPTQQDDAYKITGNGHGVNRNGVSYTSVITSPLRVHWGCPYITQGTVEITPEGHPVRTIDYGNGDCDNTYTVTVNGQSHTVTIELTILIPTETASNLFGAVPVSDVETSLGSRRSRIIKLMGAVGNTTPFAIRPDDRKTHVLPSAHAIPITSRGARANHCLYPSRIVILRSHVRAAPCGTAGRRAHPA